MHTAKVPSRTIAASGWGWTWAVHGSADFTGWTFTQAGARRASARYLADEVDRYHRHQEMTHG